MLCPNCKCDGFKPSKDVKKALVNLGGKEKFASVDYRRYVCLHCGYAFKTEEVFCGEIKTRKKDEYVNQ